MSHADRPVGGNALGGYDEYVDDLELEFVDGTSHVVADERPDVVLERALEFFAQP